MGNQQESLKLAWLGGIIDGEGSISLRKKSKKNGKFLLYPSVTVVNTDLKIIDELKNIYNTNNFAYWVTEWEGTKRWRKRYQLEVAGVKRLSRFLPILNKYLVGKYEQSELLLQWCLYRLGQKHSPYTEIDLEVHQAIKDLNKFVLKSSETICETLKEKI